MPPTQRCHGAARLMGEPDRAGRRFGVQASVASTRVALILLPALHACTPLPDVNALIEASSGSRIAPPVVDTRGSLPHDRQRETLRELAVPHSEPGMLVQHLAVSAVISSAPIVAGNRLTIIEDGSAIEDAILDAVAAARNHVNIETYTLADDEVGRRFADLLIRKRGEGVSVVLMYDSFASFGTSRAFFDRLRN